MMMKLINRNGKHMRLAWDRMARKNPMYYVATGNREWELNDFFATGHKDVNRIMSLLQENENNKNYNNGNGNRNRNGKVDRLLEIGCGVGRMSNAFVQYAEVVDAIDISREMINQAQSINTTPDRLRFTVCQDFEHVPFASAEFDVVVTYLVFQHIPYISMISRYLNEMARVMKPDGCGVVHFDTRPEGMANRLYKSLPDFILPEVHRRYLRRYRRDHDTVVKLFEDSGLTIAREYNAECADNLFVLKRG